MRTAALLLTVVVLAAGCGLLGGQEAAEEATTAPPSEVASASPTPSPTVTATPTATPTPRPTPAATEPADPDAAAVADMPFAEVCGLAGEELCRDDNANGWPDVWEEAAGRDASVDACLTGDCIGTSLEEFLISLQENTLFVLDASGSMAGDAGGGQTKMAAAKEALLRHVDATPDFADLGLMVYGHQGDNTDGGRSVSCAGIDTFAEIGGFTKGSAAGVVEQFTATGWTPVAAALDAAGPVLQSAIADDAAEGIEGATNRIILISDGIETCDGDPVASARGLVDQGIQVVVDVIGFDIGESDRAALQEVATVTGGRYVDAADGGSLQDALSDYNRQWQEAAGPIGCARVALRDGLQCNNVLGRDIQAALFEETRDLFRTDPERAQFLQDLLVRVQSEQSQRNTDLIAEREAQIAEFQTQLEAAIAAAEAAHDGAAGSASTVSSAFRCSLQDEGGGVVT